MIFSSLLIFEEGVQFVLPAFSGEEINDYRMIITRRQG